eukprot:3339147-Karenia_brevis.AAC.1
MLLSTRSGKMISSRITKAILLADTSSPDTPPCGMALHLGETNLIWAMCLQDSVHAHPKICVLNAPTCRSPGVSMPTASVKNILAVCVNVESA